MSEENVQNEDMMELIKKYAPELAHGITQAEIDGIISQTMMAKAVAERNMNIAIKKLIEVAKERDVLASEVIALRAQVRAMTEAFKDKKEHL